MVQTIQRFDSITTLQRLNFGVLTLSLLHMRDSMRAVADYRAGGVDARHDSFIWKSQLRMCAGVDGDGDDGGGGGGSGGGAGGGVRLCARMHDAKVAYGYEY